MVLTLNSRRGNPTGEINAAAYGADPTGVSDSSAAIQSAIDAAYAAPGGTVVIPPGTYKIATSLQLKSGVTLRGYGAALTCYIPGLGDDTIQAPVIFAQSTTHARIFGLEIDGRKASFADTQYKPGICVIDSRYLAIRDVYSHDNKGDGILLFETIHDQTQKNQFIDVYNSRFVANYRNGGSLTTGEHVRFTNCRFDLQIGTNPQSGFDVEPDHLNAIIEDVGFVGCTFNGNGDVNITDGAGLIVSLRASATRQRNVWATGCTMDGNAAHGVQLWRFTSVKLTDCYIQNNGYRGLEAKWDASDLTLDGCTFRANVSTAIVLGNATYTLTGARIDNCDITGSGDGGDGIQVQAGTVVGLAVANTRTTGVRYGVNTTSGTSNLRLTGNSLAGTTAATNLNDDSATRRVVGNPGVTDYPATAQDGSPHPGWKIASLYGPNIGPLNTSVALPADTLRGTLIFVPGAYTIDQLSLRVATAAAAGKILWAAIYAVGSDGRPAARLAVSTSVAADSTGDKTFTVSLTTTGPTWIFVAALSDGAPNVYGVSAHSRSDFGGLTASTALQSGYQALLSGGGGASAPADPFPASGQSAQSTAPLIYVRRSA